MRNKNILLTDAYSLKTPQDSKKFYKNWASTYDKEFVKKTKYLSPLKISFFFKQHFKKNDSPILDVGAGTGLIGEYLNKKKDKDLIGIDISAEMLKQAELKKCYNSLLVVDVTKKIPLKSNSIGAVVSAGTFTHGHVGPQALDELLRITKPNGLFVISIKKELFISEGFKDKFINIKKKITLPTFNLFSIFGKNNDKKHGNDKAYVAIFRKKN